MRNLCISSGKDILISSNKDNGYVYIKITEKLPVYYYNNLDFNLYQKDYIVGSTIIKKEEFEQLSII